MHKRTLWRSVLSLLVITATVVVFVLYFNKHPEVRRQLQQLSLAALALLLVLYAFFIVSLALINNAALRLCRSRLGGGESLLLTMYSSVINFFGPLQSGPAFRAVYLKKKHGVTIADYTFASFVYYFFYAAISVILLFSSTLKWWLVPLGLGVLALVWVAYRAGAFRLKSGSRLDVKQWPYMAAASLLQVLLLLAIFYTELKIVMPSVSLSQAAVYTGAANLALFVSITPGAIGFRESFLVFSQNLHHISNATIVSANIIDRTVYIIMLGCLTLIIFATTARSYLQRGLE